MGKTRQILPSTEDYVFFVDIRDKSQMYAITKGENQREMEVKEKFDFKEENVPDGFFVNAFKVEKVRELDSNTEEYDILNFETIKFPINKIEWIFIRVSNSRNENS